MRATVVITGDEVLRGRINDRNLALIAAALEPRGIRVDEARVVGDDIREIAVAVREALGRGSELVATTGGLGPTADDLSMEGVARALDLSVEVNDEALELVSRRNDRVPASADARRAAARRQAT
ncbi:MAG: molybdopterin-binding protein, partial [Miltoncostaeaceae bacterium]